MCLPTENFFTFVSFCFHTSQQITRLEDAEVVIGKKNKPKTDYYVSIRVVDGFGEKGFLYLNAYMKNGLYRNAVKGKTKKLPVCPAIQVKGYEVE